MLDVTLLKDPVFMLIGVSNIFGMAGLYVPFVYLVDAAGMEVIFLVFSSFSLENLPFAPSFRMLLFNYNTEKEIDFR